MSSTTSPPTSSFPKGGDNTSEKDGSSPPGAENTFEGAETSAEHHPVVEKTSSAPVINKHDLDGGDDDDEHDLHPLDEHDDEYPSDDEYSYGNDGDEYISEYIQNEIERQLTEEIDAALQREIDAQLDRAMEECERELDRQLEEEIGRSLSQSVQIGDGRYDDEFDADDDRPCMYRYCSSSSSTHATNTKSASSKSNVAKTSGYGPKGDDIATASKKGGEDDVDLPGEVAEKKLLNQNTTKNEGNSNSRSAASSSMKAATSVVDVNRAIQSVIDSHKIR